MRGQFFIELGISHLSELFGSKQNIIFIRHNNKKGILDIAFIILTIISFLYNTKDAMILM